jgi:hypothetical protein
LRSPSSRASAIDALADLGAARLEFFELLGDLLLLFRGNHFHCSTAFLPGSVLNIIAISSAAQSAPSARMGA